MNPILRQICGCEICIIPKAMQVDLNRFRTKRVSYSQHKCVGIHTQNNAYSNTSYSYYKEKLFPGGDCLHDNIKYADQYISFTHIKPENIINMKCDLYFCGEYHKYIITDA